MRERQTRLNLLNTISTGMIGGSSAFLETIEHAVHLWSRGRFPQQHLTYATISAEGMLTICHSIAPAGLSTTLKISVDLNMEPEYLQLIGDV